MGANLYHNSITISVSVSTVYLMVKEISRISGQLESIY